MVGNAALMALVTRPTAPVGVSDESQVPLFQTAGAYPDAAKYCSRFYRTLS